MDLGNLGNSNNSGNSGNLGDKVITSKYLIKGSTS